MFTDPHVPHPALFQDGRKVRLGDIIGEGAVTEDDIRLAYGFQFLVPADHTERQRFHIGNNNIFGEAHQKSACADALYCLPAAAGRTARSASRGSRPVATGVFTRNRPIKLLSLGR